MNKYGSEEIIDDGRSNSYKEDPYTKRAIRGIRIGIILVIAAVLALNCAFMLSEDKVAVVTTFGQPQPVTKTGLNFKIPFIQGKYKMSKENM